MLSTRAKPNLVRKRIIGVSSLSSHDERSSETARDWFHRLRRLLSDPPEHVALDDLESKIHGYKFGLFGILFTAHGAEGTKK